MFAGNRALMIQREVIINYRNQVLCMIFIGEIFLELLKLNLCMKYLVF